MKIFRFLSVAYLLAACSLHAQQLQWKPLHLSQGQYVRTLFTHGSVVSAGTTAGVFRSVDHGGNWTKTELSNGSVKSFAVSPAGAKAQYLFACSSGGGVFRSADSGKSWEAVNNGLPSPVVEDIAACSDGSGGTNLFAALYYGEVYRSTDDGASWSAVNPGIAKSALITSIAACPNDSGGTDLFIGTSRDGLYRSSDDGKHWIQVYPWSPTHIIFDLSVIPLADGKPAIYALSYGGIYRSRNRGTDWEYVSGKSGNSIVTNGSMLYMSTDNEGVLSSSDFGATWTKDGLYGPVYALTVSDSLLIAATDWGTHRKPCNSTAQWAMSNNGLMCLNPSSFAVLGSDIFTGTYGGVYRFTTSDTSGSPVNNGLTSSLINSLAAVDSFLFAGTEDQGVFRSPDHGDHWTPLTAGITDAYITGLASDQKIIAASTNWGNIFLSSDTGRTWMKLSPQVSYPCFLSLCVRDSDIYAGSIDGKIFHSPDLGATWTERMIDSAMYLPYGEIGSLMMKGDRLYAVTEYDLYVSMDKGASWKSCGLREQYPASLAANETLLVAGTSNGVFISKTAGADWHPRVMANEIGGKMTAIAIVGDKIYAGRQEGAMYYKTISDALTAVREPGASVPVGFMLHQNYPNPFNPSTTIAFTIPERSFVELKVFDVLGREIGVIVSEMLAAGSYSRRWDASGLSSGVYFYQIRAGAFVQTQKMVIVK